MVYVKIREQHMKDYIVEQLKNKYGYTDTAGKSRKELTFILARFRAMEVDISSSENEWF